jgi:hypothetical protein
VSLCHLLMIGQGGTIGHEDAIADLTLFLKEVLLRPADPGH